MNKIINRNLTLEFDLDKLSKDFGYNLEVDEQSDVYHDGYSTKNILDMNLNLPEKYQDLEKVFPKVVSIALEDSERSAWASYIRKERINALKECLEKIDLSSGGAEYTSVEQLDVSTKAGITSVEIDEANNKVLVSILNPEHLINSVVNGKGYIYPDLPAQTESSNNEIISRFHNLKDYFEVYDESKPSENIDNRYSPDVDQEYFAGEISCRLDDLTIDEVVSSVKDAIDEENDAFTIINLVTKFTEFNAKEIAEKLLEDVESEFTNWKSNLSSFLGGYEKISLSKVKEEVQFSLSNLIDMTFPNASIRVFGYKETEEYPILKKLNFGIKLSKMDDIVFLFKGDEFLIESKKHDAIEIFSQKIMEELS